MINRIHWIYFFPGFRMKPRKHNRVFSAKKDQVTTNPQPFADISLSQSPFLRRGMMLFAFHLERQKYLVYPVILSP